MHSGLPIWIGLALLVGADPATAAKPLIGSVDVLRLQNEYTQARMVRAELESEGHKYEAELREGQKRLGELESRIASADLAAKAATGDAEVRRGLETAKEAEEAARERTGREFAQRLRERREKAERLQRELNEVLLQTARIVIEKVAKRHGLDAVIDARAALWGALDLTEDVLKSLNASPSAR